MPDLNVGGQAVIEGVMMRGTDRYAVAVRRTDGEIVLASKKIPSFARDAKNIRSAAVVLLVGVTGEPKRPENPLDCGACGYSGCAEFMGVGKA